MDIALSFNRDIYFSDIVVEPPGLQIDRDLQTAVIISLFCNRLCDKSQVEIDEDRQGWWGDSFAEVNGSKIGSRLWLLKRQKSLQSVANLGREYCLEALQWLLEDRIANSVNVNAEIIDIHTLGIDIEIVRPKDIQNFKFNYVWSQIRK